MKMMVMCCFPKVGNLLEEKYLMQCRQNMMMFMMIIIMLIMMMIRRTAGLCGCGQSVRIQEKDTRGQVIDVPKKECWGQTRSQSKVDSKTRKRVETWRYSVQNQRLLTGHRMYSLGIHICGCKNTTTSDPISFFSYTFHN